MTNQITITKIDGGKRCDTEWFIDRDGTEIAVITREMWETYTARTALDACPMGRAGKVAGYGVTLTNGTWSYFEVKTDGEARTMLAAAKKWAVENG